MDPHHFNADPDPAFHFNADPDPIFHFNADPDPAPHQIDATTGLQTLHASILSLLGPPLLFWASKAPEFWLPEIRMELPEVMWIRIRNPA